MPTYNAIVSEFDKNAYELIRNNVRNFISEQLCNINSEANILEIAPQIHNDVTQGLLNIKTFDIDPTSWADYIWDITKLNSLIEDESFDLVICTEVLEHTLQPFDAINEISRILKKGGKLLLSTPYNFRIHWPLPDCWRFTEYWLMALLKNFSSVTINDLKTDWRDLMPIHYTVIAIK